MTSLFSLRGRQIGVIGLGYVGTPLAVEFGMIRSVIGFDISQSRVTELQSGYDRTLEFSSDQLVSAHYLKFSTDEADLDGCSVFIVTVPTPVDSANRPDLSPLIMASEMLGRHLKAGDVVIYESTVFPGATEEVCVPALERSSGLCFNVDFFCGYSPERINPGDKEHTLTTIKKIVSGSTQEVTLAIDALYQEIITAGTWAAPSIKVAEAAKVIENAQRDLNIAFVNELSIIFQRLGIDTLDVLEAAGTKWNFLSFRPGLVGGHCIGVDPYYLTHKAEMLGYHSQVILAGRRINDSMSVFIAQETIKRLIDRGGSIKGASVILLGLTFKENCADIRNSKVVHLAQELKDFGCEVIVHDPIADVAEARREYGIELNPWEELPKADALIAAVSHQQYCEVSVETLLEKLKPGGVFVDVKSAYSRQAIMERGFRVWRL